MENIEYFPIQDHDEMPDLGIFSQSYKVSISMQKHCDLILCCIDQLTQPTVLDDDQCGFHAGNDGHYGESGTIQDSMGAAFVPNQNGTDQAVNTFAKHAGRAAAGEVENLTGSLPSWVGRGWRFDTL
jgi:hypothetical protein